MLMHVHAKDGTVYRVGDRLVSIKESSDIGMCPTGVDVEIVIIHQDKQDGGNINIGVKSEQELPGWHDLDGTCNHGYGLWVTLGTLNKCFELKPNAYEIVKDFSYRKRNLKGMKFRLLSNTPDSQMLVELEENVGGCGGDGLGKAGHCVLLPRGLAKPVEGKKNKK